MTSDNAIRRAIAEGRRIRGVHLTFPAPAIIEILASLRLDFVYLDGEHGSFDLRDIEAACIMAERHGITPIARVSDNSAATITRFLDRGVRGIIVPHVETAAEARRAVEACFFAPLGGRSFGGGRPEHNLGIADRPAYLAAANQAVTLSVMIESAAGLAALDEIAATPGVDYLSFGMMDLAQSLGHAGEPRHPAVLAAVADASERIRAAGKPIREDVMTFAWIQDLIVLGARRALGLDRDQA